MAVHRTNRPLMIYTSLIFIVAIVMVVVAFLGQRHLEDTQTQQSVENQGISQRATQLSERNLALTEANKTLTDENTALTEERDTLTQENELLAKENEQNEKLYEVYSAIEDRKYSYALSLLKNIYTEDLTDYQKDFYNELVKKCK